MPARGASGDALNVFDRILAYGELATLAGISQAIATLEMVLASRPETAGALGLGFLNTLKTNARRLLAESLENDSELRRAWHVIDLAFATLRGYATSGLLTDPRGFDAIDHLDCREWLRQNGASEEALESDTCAVSTTSASPTRTATTRSPASRRARRCAGSYGPSSRIAARFSGRCRAGWATSFSPRSTRFCGVVVSASSSFIG
jgi:hypothetical protein